MIFASSIETARGKKLEITTYTISDAIQGIYNESGSFGLASALSKMDTQANILKGIKSGLESALFNIEDLLRADIFDSELDSAEHLASRGHLRAAGAVAGVVLESHLGMVSDRHGFASRKKNPTISDFNDFLRNANVYGVPVWRRIQSLGDIRNICDHAKGKEPIEADLDDLISGVKRVIKEVF